MKSAEFHRGYENCNPLSFSITLNSNENTISSFLSYSGQLNSYGMSAVVLYIPDTVFPNIDEKEIPLTREYDISGNESTSEEYLLCGASYIWGQRRYSDADAQGKWIYSSETSGNYRFYFSGSSYINDAYVSIKNIYVK